MPSVEEIVNDSVEKVKKILPLSTLQELESLSAVDLRSAIATAQIAIRDLNIEASRDEPLQSAKEIVKDLSVPYKQEIKLQKAIMTYCGLLLDQE